jgi:threonine dehydrogenase-like Zn-dependent dehydrogenase
VKTLLFERSMPRLAASRLVSSIGSGRGAKVGPLRLTDTDAPDLPGPGWHRVSTLLSGICGSDLAALDGRSSRYFEELVSFPFVPGHEIVGTLEAPGRSAKGEDLDAGTRVVLEPVLGCTARGIDPPCDACAAGRSGDCEHVAFGHLRPGLQTGFCADTGGGWSAAGLVAHESQLHAVPDELTDRDAVTIEPMACALHSALAAQASPDDVVAVLGAGTLGLATVAALSHLGAVGLAPFPRALLVGARYPHQQEMAAELGATGALKADQLARAVRRQSRSLSVGSVASGRLTGGADVVFDCVGSAETIARSIAMVRPKGRIVLVGMPSRVSIDLAPLWHREVSLMGTYAYGTETTSAGPRPTFDLAIEAVSAMRTGRLVSATYPLDRFEEAVAHAGSAGRRGAVKIAFDVGAGRGGRR